MQAAPRTRAAGAGRAEVLGLPEVEPWNRRVDKLPVARNSAAVIALDRRRAPACTPTSAPASGRASPIGIPFDVVTRKTPRARRWAFEYADESDRVGYPIPKRVHIEGGSDHHALLLDRDACRLYELGGLEKQSGRWHGLGAARPGACARTTSGPRGWTSADAAGLPIFPAWPAGTRRSAA